MLKEVSALRDDVKKLFTDITEKLKIKISILQDILERESDKRYLIRTDSISQLLNAIENDNYLYEAIDVIDFEISELKNRICEIAGITPQGFEDHISQSNSSLSSEYRTLIHRLDGVFKNLYGERKKLIKEMEEKIDTIDFDLESLRRVMKLKGS
jgi:ABC-type phosphate transport system auxiliary subunit